MDEPGFVLTVCVITGVVASFISCSYGEAKGIKQYHNTCFYGPPGMIVDEKDKTVVQCTGVGKIPENEVPFNQIKRLP